MSMTRERAQQILDLMPERLPVEEVVFDRLAQLVDSGEFDLLNATLRHDHWGKVTEVVMANGYRFCRAE